MAFVIERPKTKGWTAVWKGQDGKQVRRVTGETSKRTAQAKANEWELEARKNSKIGAEINRAGLAILEQATRDFKTGHLTLTRVEELIFRLHRLADPNFKEIFVIPWFEAWIESQIPHVEPSTQKGYRDDLAIMKEGLGKANALKPLRELEPREIEKALVRAKNANRAGSTVNKAFVSFRRACADAEAKGLITTSPARTVKALPTDDSTEKAPFTYPEVRTLLMQAATDKLFLKIGTSNEWRGLIIFGAHTGLRLSDILKLTDKDMHGTEIHLRPKKTKRHKTVVKIPLSPTCIAWIEGKKGKLFPVLGNQATSKTSTQFSALMKKANVPHEIEITSDLSASRSFHSLRHTFNAWLTDAGVSQDQRKKLTGHKSDRMNDIYTHVASEVLLEVVSKMPCI